jgi:hypothetical protein
MATSVPRAHRDAHVGGGQGRGVVDAVTHHRHLAAGRQDGLQLGHQARLVGRQDLGVHFSDAHGLGECGRAAGVVAGQQHRANTQRRQLAHRVGGIRLGGVRKGQQAQQMRLALQRSEAGHGVPLFLPGFHLGLPWTQVHTAFLHPAQAAQAQGLAQYIASHTAPGYGTHIGSQRHGQPFITHHLEHRTRQGVGAAGLQGGSGLQQVCTFTLRGHGLHQLRPARA